MNSTNTPDDSSNGFEDRAAAAKQGEAANRELEVILERVERRIATADDRLRLNSLLRSDASCRAAYLGWMDLNSELAWHFLRTKPLSAEKLLRFSLAESLVPDEPAMPAEPGASKPPTAVSSPAAPSTQSSAAQSASAQAPAKSPVLGFLGGALDYVNQSRMLMFWLMALSLSGWFIFQIGSLMMDRFRPGDARVADQQTDPNSADVSHRPGGSFAPSASPRQSDSVAWMTAVVDCHWRVVPPAVPSASAPTPGDVDTRDAAFHVGSELSVGQQLDLVRGLAEITFRSGAKIVLNGPAHFAVRSPLGGALAVGKLTARVPHDAHGFTVDTPAGKVVDLGTEFGVLVADDHSMVVEVFVGEVAVDAPADGQSSGSSARVEAGHAARVVPGKPVVSVPLDPNRFVRGLGPREDKHVTEAAYLDWMKSLKPVVWFRMEGNADDRVLHDEMGGPDAKLHWDGPGNPFVEGRLGKCVWLRGQKLHDGAIVPSYPQADKGKLSVAAWVYMDTYPPIVEAAPAVGNWADTNGFGQFSLALGGQDGKSTLLVAYITQRDGSVLWLTEPAGAHFPLYAWQHIAFTTDGTTLRLYRGGREVSKLKHAGLQFPVRQKALGIGVRPNNAGTAASNTDPNNWSGKLDEIAIFNDVLTADQIHQMAEAPP